MDFKLLLPLLCLTALLAACNPFRPQPRPAPVADLPPSFALYSGARDSALRWWETFEDPELDALVEEALGGSLTVRKAWARLKQARAKAVQAGAGLYPDLTGEVTGDYRRRREAEKETRDYSLGLASSYELDLWGRIRSEEQAAALEATATREDLNAAAMTVAGEVAQRWGGVISERMQRRLLERQLAINLTYLELVQLRFRKAMVSALDVYQQKQIVEEVRAQIPLVEGNEQLLLNELAVLLGSPPRRPLKITRADLPVPGAVPATGLPADLLEDRPDIRAAWLRLESSDWQVAAARADRLPAIRLSAAAGYQADIVNRIFDDWFLGLLGGLTAPILDGGRRAAEVDRTRAVTEENLQNYRETVLTAMKEVEDALVREAKQRQHLEGLERETEAARRALEEARERYRKGLNDYLPVLTQLLAVQRLERELIRQRAQLLLDRIGLYRALGGSWPQTLLAENPAPETVP